MKKYMICLYLSLTVSVVCIAAGYAAARYQKVNDTSAATAETAIETETEDRDREAANRELVKHQVENLNEYYLVSENGFLMVFTRDQESVCLYTHIPIVEMPLSEQDKLREGIWFPTMSELFQYLESYTS